MYVCKTAVELLGESDRFPDDWLMMHRWGKGKKNGGKLPNGAKITFLKVGGRTSAVVPSVQKKTGAVAGDVSEDANGAEDSGEDVKPKCGNKRKGAVKEEDQDEEEVRKETKATTAKRAKKSAVKSEDEDVEDTAESKDIKKPVAKGARGKGATTKTDELGRRRSGRIAKG